MNIHVYGSSSKGNCYVLEHGGDSLMLDIGLNIGELAKKGVLFNKINGVLVSHVHKDHSKGVKAALRLGVSVYVSEHTKHALGVKIERNLHSLEHNVLVKIGKFEILPFKLEHDVPNLGFYIRTENEKILYITDTYFCRYKFKGLTRILIECNHSYSILNERVKNGELHNSMKNRLINSHFALENVLMFLQANDLSQVKEIYLIHLSDSNSNADEFKKAVQRATGKVVIVADA